MTSCLTKYIEYVYEPKYNAIQHIDNNVYLFIDIVPISSEYNNFKQVVSGPYEILVSIGGHLDLLESIEIDGILLIMNNNTINLFERDFNIYDSSLKRDYNEKEKENFFLYRKIKSQFVDSDCIVIRFENIEIIYNDVSIFEIIVEVKLKYHNNNYVSKRIIYEYCRKKNSQYLIPTT
jgi:hypothetical protein